MSRHSKPSTRGVRRLTRLRYTRLRAVLAGALVLGVGATVTLASWNDSENARADITAGSFDIVGSVDGAAFSSHGATTAAVLSFPFPASGFAPGVTTYALLSVKTSTVSVAGTVNLAADATNATSGTAPNAGLGAFLTYGVTNIPSGAAGACNATSFAGGAVIIPVNSALTTSQPAATVVPVGAKGASQVNLCFAVTMPAAVDNAAQGKSAAPKWTVNAVSTAS